MKLKILSVLGLGLLFIWILSLIVIPLQFMSLYNQPKIPVTIQKKINNQIGLEFTFIISLESYEIKNYNKKYNPNYFDEYCKIMVLRYYNAQPDWDIDIYLTNLSIYVNIGHYEEGFFNLTFIENELKITNYLWHFSKEEALSNNRVYFNFSFLLKEGMPPHYLFTTSLMELEY